MELRASKIRPLDSLTIDKIAAGEVVERPASIVKELVENAIDSGATTIRIDIVDGGRQLIRVSDNGCGMWPEELPLAVTRHATSKITNSEDLYHLSSMGFRGEALASIGSVARLTLSSQSADADGGQIHVEGGRISEVRQWYGDQGSVVQVEDLFYNVPARLKFLKSAQHESSVIQELVTSYALQYHRLNLVLRIQEKNKLECFACDSLEQRIAQLFDDTISSRLLTLERADRYAKIECAISPPGLSFANSKHMVFFVNGRLVRDKNLRYAVLRGYHSHLLRGRYPFAVVKLEVDPSLVDVNVHPAKTEVRWQYQTEIQSLLALGIRECIQKQWQVAPVWSAPEILSPAPKPIFSNAWSSQRPRAESPRFEGPSMGVAPVVSAKTDTPPRLLWSELRWVGTFARCYLLFESDREFVVVDQHAFHERVIYERLLKREDLLRESQPLAIPEYVALSADDCDSLIAMQSAGQLLGFDVRRIDATGVEVCALPSLVARRSTDELLREVLGQYSVGESAHHLLSTMACHAAVRAGEELDEEELSRLLAEAATVDFYHNCPHGRPVFKRWSREQVAGWFDR